MDLFRRLPAVWLLLPLLLLFFFLALNSMVSDSPTMDEQNHLARGLAFLATGDPRFSLEHPPLLNTLSALPVYLLTDVTIPLDDPSWEQREGWYAFAERLLWQSGNDVSLILFLARLPILFVTMGLALVGYHFSRALWSGGRAPAFFAAACLLFDPNLLAHGRYTTTDVGGAAFLLLATFLLWRWWQVKDARWEIASLLAAAVGLGLAFAGKLSTLTFAPLFLLLAALPLYGQPWRWRDAARRMIQLAAAGGGSLLLVWAVYGFQWAAFDFQSSFLQPLNCLSGPMPTYWAGLEQILFLSGGGRASYLGGQFSDTGFPLYFPIAFALKTPLPLLLLLPASAFILLRQTQTRGRALFLLLPAFLYFLLSTQSALNIGYRHLFPILPLLYLLAAGLGSRKRLSAHLVLAAAAFSILISALLIHPHHLSYFNLAAGGPLKGGQILIDSNIDWGQDLIRLQRWLAAQGVSQVKLSWFGSADPAYYGISYEPLPGVPRHFDLWWNVPFDRTQPPPGLYAISVSNLGEPPLRTAEKTVFAWFRARQPTARIGYSIYIYDVR